MIQGIFDYGAMPTLERSVQFTEQRHRLITHNIANLNTPDFQPQDLDVAGFQNALRSAIDQRRRGESPLNGPLQLPTRGHVAFGRRGLNSRHQPLDGNTVSQDRSTRNLERQMQDLVETSMAHSAALRMLQNRFTLLETAISERL